MYEKIIKRGLDIILCIVALVALSPIFLITAIAIKLSSPGEILYRSERMGKDHKPFRFYKFRSMHVTTKDKGLFVADEERLFTVGKIIRKLKIDELPQLINVIKGDMSIVGPRPMPSDTVDKVYYGHYQRILSVNPGLTSAASLFDYMVGDTYSNNDAYIRDVLPVKLELEMLYIEKQSFIYDAQMVIRTILTILQVFLGKKEFKTLAEIKLIENKISGM